MRNSCALTTFLSNLLMYLAVTWFRIWQWSSQLHLVLNQLHRLAWWAVVLQVSHLLPVCISNLEPGIGLFLLDWMMILYKVIPLFWVADCQYMFPTFFYRLILTFAEILVAFRNATQCANKWAKAWHTWALFNTAVMSLYTVRGYASAASQFVVAAVTGYFHSIACSANTKGVDDSLQVKCPLSKVFQTYLLVCFISSIWHIFILL